jgi:isochorismate pyruvate lyase
MGKRPDPATLPDMAAVRDGIDAIDGELMALLAERQAYVDRAIHLKPAEGIAASAPSRAAAVIANARMRAEAAGFDPDLAETMWRAMVDAFIAREEKILGKAGDDK